MKYSLLPIFALWIACSEQQPVPQPTPSQPMADLSQPDPTPSATSPEALFNQGRSLQARADFSGAERRYRQAIASAPDNAQYPYYLGTVLHATSRYGEARAAFEKSIQLKNDYAAPRIALGKLLYDVDGNADKARLLLEEALSLAPHATEAQYTLGIIQLREGLSEEAVNLFSQLVKSDSSNAQARTQLGLAYLQQNDLVRAQEELQRAASTAPYYSPAYHGLGQTFIRQGKVDVGQRLLQRAQQLEEEATQLTPHQNALRQNPNQPPAHYNLASMYARFGRLREAAQHFSQAITLDSTYALAYQGLGNLYQRLGSTPESRATYAGRARALYQRALQLNPQLAETHNNLGLLLHSTGDVATAVEHYEKAAELEPQAGFYQANLSRGHFELKQYDSARQAAERAIQADPSLNGAHETLGDIYAAQGDWTNALSAWENIGSQNTTEALDQKIAQARSYLSQ